MIHNQLTNYAQLLAGFRRMLGEMGADFSGIERAGETLTPVMDPWALPEWALLRGEVIFSRSLFVGAAALTFSSVELVNPVGSGILATVLEITSRNDGFEVGVESGGALGAAATTQGVANDSRFPQLGAVSRCTVVSGQLAGALALPQDNLSNAAVNIGRRPYILRPGTKLMLLCNAVNLSIGTSLLWTERPLLPNEQAT